MEDDFPHIYYYMMMFQLSNEASSLYFQYIHREYNVLVSTLLAAKLLAAMLMKECGFH